MLRQTDKEYWVQMAVKAENRLLQYLLHQCCKTMLQFWLIPAEAIFPDLTDGNLQVFENLPWLA